MRRGLTTGLKALASLLRGCPDHPNCCPDPLWARHFQRRDWPSPRPGCRARPQMTLQSFFKMRNLEKIKPTHHASDLTDMLGTRSGGKARALNGGSGSGHTEVQGVAPLSHHAGAQVRSGERLGRAEAVPWGLREPLQPPSRRSRLAQPRPRRSSVWSPGRGRAVTPSWPGPICSAPCPGAE